MRPAAFTELLLVFVDHTAPDMAKYVIIHFSMVKYNKLISISVILLSYIHRTPIIKSDKHENFRCLLFQTFNHHSTIQEIKIMTAEFTSAEVQPRLDQRKKHEKYF